MTKTKPLTGENIYVDTNGQYSSRGNIINGLVDGKRIWWHENGSGHYLKNSKELYQDS